VILSDTQDRSSVLGSVSPAPSSPPTLQDSQQAEQEQQEQRLDVPSANEDTGDVSSDVVSHSVLQ
jgi:hypothetical protein